MAGWDGLTASDLDQEGKKAVILSLFNTSGYYFDCVGFRVYLVCFHRGRTDRFVCGLRLKTLRFT